jgi:hypothetical protein
VRTIKTATICVDARDVTPLRTATAPGSVPSRPVARVTAAGPVAAAPPPTPPLAPRPALAVRAARLARQRPERSEELRHMTLERLRTYRRTLLAEELSTSYWRRLLQARRDLLKSSPPPGDRVALREALAEERGQGGRQSIMALHPAGGMPILPLLPDLWATEIAPPGSVAARELTIRLTSAESVLSSYREALHRRLNRATADLVARYHEDPRLCFSLLPDVG